MYDFPTISSSQMGLMFLGLILFMLVPLAIAIIWTVVKKERFTTILVGAGTFLLFALILEKPIQNVLIFPTYMGLPDHAVARFINARPVLWSILVGFFPGLFEETGRLVAFKTILKKRTNRETSLSYGIGHGGFEVMLILGITYVQYLIYSAMINSGAFAITCQQIAALAPDQLDAYLALPEQLAAFTFGTLVINAFERIFAVLYHIGASVLVFYACKDKKKFWLYPLAIVIHTAMDGMLGLNMKGVISLSDWGLEIIVLIVGSLTFFGSYFMLYKKDPDTRTKEPNNDTEPRTAQNN